jgi:hypothetical protein
VDDVPVFALGAAHVLFQGATEGHVDSLEAATHGQQRKAQVQGPAGDFEVEGVLDVVDVVDAVVGVGGSVAVGSEVTATGEQDTVEAGETRGHVRDGGISRVDGRRFAAGPPHRLDQGAGVDLGGVPQG